VAAHGSTAWQRQQRGDSAGLVLSGVCLVHCLAAPALVALIPAFTFGMSHQMDRLVHWGLLLLAIPISLWTLRQGLKSHGQRRWLLVGLLGLSLMLGGVLVHTANHQEIWLTMAGVLILAAAHVMNWATTLRYGNCLIAPLRACDHQHAPAPRICLDADEKRRLIR
jgi:hypothetical protein